MLDNDELTLRISIRTAGVIERRLESELGNDDLTGDIKRTDTYR